MRLNLIWVKPVRTQNCSQTTNYVVSCLLHASQLGKQVQLSMQEQRHSTSMQPFSISSAVSERDWTGVGEATRLHLHLYNPDSLKNEPNTYTRCIQTSVVVCTPVLPAGCKRTRLARVLNQLRNFHAPSQTSHKSVL